MVEFKKFKPAVLDEEGGFKTFDDADRAYEAKSGAGTMKNSFMQSNLKQGSKPNDNFARVTWTDLAAKGNA